MRKIMLVMTILLLWALPLLAEDCLSDFSECRELALTAGQKQELQKLRQDIQERNEVSWQRIKTIKDRIEQEIAKEDPSKLKLKELNKDLAEEQRQVSESSIDYRLEMKRIIGRKNYEKLQEIKQKKTEELKNEVRRQNQRKSKDCENCD